MAAKITLGLLAEEQPEAWRRGRSAELLRERMRDLDRPARDVPLTSAAAVDTFAPAPCTTVVVTSRGGGPAAFVTLLGAFTMTLPLGEDLRDFEHVWVCDALDPTASASGSLALVVGQRLGFADAA